MSLCALLSMTAGDKPASNRTTAFADFESGTVESANGSGDGAEHAWSRNETNSGLFHVDDADIWRTASELVESVVYTKLVPAVCLFGIVGNIANLLNLICRSFDVDRRLKFSMVTEVLRRRQSAASAERKRGRMEKSAQWSLISLAVCDLAICIAVLPNSLLAIGGGGGGGGFLHDTFDFRLACKLYGGAVVNTLQLMSTWLTVAMSVSWYLVVCRPLDARRLIGRRYAVASLSTVVIVCTAFNMPRFFRDELRSITCDLGGLDVSAAGIDDDSPISTPPSFSLTNASDFVAYADRPPAVDLYFVYPGPLRRTPVADVTYSWMYFVLGIVVPLSVLVFSSWHLAAGLRQSARLRAECTRSRSAVAGGRFSGAVVRLPSGGGNCETAVDRHLGHPFRDTDERRSGSMTSTPSSNRRLTLTTVVVVVGHVILFVPAELFGFFTELAVARQHRTALYNASLAVGNLLQVLNFAANFVVYCAVNGWCCTGRGTDSRARSAPGHGQRCSTNLLRVIGAMAISSGPATDFATAGQVGRDGNSVDASLLQKRGHSEAAVPRLEARRYACVVLN
jgi:hypothetical protein